MVSLSAPVSMITLGYFLKGDSFVILFSKLLCYSNLINLLPFTSDGEIILMSLMNIIRRKK